MSIDEPCVSTLVITVAFKFYSNQIIIITQLVYKFVCSITDITSCDTLSRHIATVKRMQVLNVATGHFTQVVWKGSHEVGLGRAQAADGKWFVCGNFYPAGNYVGQNAENVFPTRDGKFVLPAKDDAKHSHQPGRLLNASADVVLRLLGLMLSTRAINTARTAWLGL